MIKLSIVIPVFNKFPFTKSCLNDLSKLCSNEHEIIIVDNASTDETQLEIKHFSNIKYIRNDENLFHSKACNKGYQIATGQNILFLNNDIRVKSNHTNWTEILISACEDNSIVGPTMGLLDQDFNFVKEANAQLSGNSYLSGWCVAAKKSVWQLLDKNNNGQVWSETIGHYFNDGDLSFRARKLNIPLKIIPLPDVVHFGKVSASQTNVHKLYTEGRKAFLAEWKKH